MGYIIASGLCVGCQNVFAFNPMRVPSITINGRKEPVCRACVDRVNPLRISNGLPPIEPLPGAYEYCDESELA